MDCFGAVLLAMTEWIGNPLHPEHHRRRAVHALFSPRRERSADAETPSRPGHRIHGAAVCMSSNGRGLPFQLPPLEKSLS